MEPNGLHAPQKTWVLNIPFNGESQIQSPRTNTGLGAGSSPQGPGLCPVMRGCLPPSLYICVCVCVYALPLGEANRLYSDSLLQKAVKVFGSALRAFLVLHSRDRKYPHRRRFSQIHTTRIKDTGTLGVRGGYKEMEKRRLRWRKIYRNKEMRGDYLHSKSEARTAINQSQEVTQ